MTKAEIREIREDVAKNLGEKEAGIFDAHMLVLEDRALIEDVKKEIKESGENVEQCVQRVTGKYLAFFDQLEDKYLRERAVDLRDISRRLQRCLSGTTASGTAFLEVPKVLVSEDLTPSDTAALDRTKILGIATDLGGQTSHAVIMARASGVPAVVGLRGLTEKLKQGDELLIDGFEGVAIINPSETTLFRYGKVDVQRRKLTNLVEKESSLPAQTADGKDMYEDAVRLMRSQDLDAFDLGKEPQLVREAYGSDKFGQGVLLARRLVEKQVRFVEVQLGGWDTHNNNYDRVFDNCNILDQALSALLDDLHKRGMLEETLVVLATEFGRTPDYNVNQGRDHYPKAFSCMLAGGGIRGGQIWGATDEEGREVVDGITQIPDFNATIAYALGLPLDEIVFSPSRRPFTLVDKGQPLTQLF